MFNLLRDLHADLYLLAVCCVENGGYSKQNGIKALQVSSCPTFLPQRATDVFNVS